MKEILIRLEDELYEQCKNTKLTEENEGFDFHIIKSVANGTVLPKGHGRLIDGNKLLVELECGIRAGNYEEGYEKYPHINDMDDCFDTVKYADTIIEADAPKRIKGTPLEENDSGYNCENWIP